MYTCRNLEDSEKDYLRGQLLQLVLEEDSQVSAVHMCLSETGHTVAERHAHCPNQFHFCLILKAGSILHKYSASLSQQALCSACFSQQATSVTAYRCLEAPPCTIQQLNDVMFLSF